MRRPAAPPDVPTILALIHELAAYEKLTAEVEVILRWRAAPRRGGRRREVHPRGDEILVLVS